MSLEGRLIGQLLDKKNIFLINQSKKTFKALYDLWFTIHAAPISLLLRKCFYNEAGNYTESS